MALTEEQSAKARQKAKEYLEIGITSLAISLGEDPDDVSSSMAIPVDESDPRHRAYLSLVDMASAMEKIQP